MSIENHIPFDKIGWQAANLGILLLIIYFSIRKLIKETFSKRRQDFLDQAVKTKSALLAAEERLKETRNNLAKLEGGESAAQENAKHEANLLKANLIKEAEAQALKIKKDAELSLLAELAKVRAEINTLILQEAVQTAKEKLTPNHANPSASKSMEAHFLKQIDRAGTERASV